MPLLKEQIYLFYFETSSHVKMCEQKEENNCENRNANK